MTFGLNFLDEIAMRFDVFSVEDVLIEEVKDEEESCDNESPVWNQSQRPVEWDSAQEPQIQRWISERRQQASGITDDEYEKQNQVGLSLTSTVRPDKRTYQ